MMQMATDQIKKVPKPPMIKMWNYGNLIGANMNIVYPENPPGVQINQFPIHQFIEKDPGNETYEQGNPSGYMSLVGNRII
jgi:hypothetical protein